jgi:hypothetical protein
MARTFFLAILALVACVWLAHAIWPNHAARPDMRRGDYVPGLFSVEEGPLRTAPHDGTPIRVFYDDPVPGSEIVRWSGQYWYNEQGMLVAKFIGWEPAMGGE